MGDTCFPYVYVATKVTSIILLTQIKNTGDKQSIILRHINIECLNGLSIKSIIQSNSCLLHGIIKKKQAGKKIEKIYYLEK